MSDWTGLLALVLFAGVAIVHVRLSRAFAFQLLLLFAVGGYILLIATVNAALTRVLGDAAWLAQFGFTAGATVAALITILSRRSRAALKVQLAKHLFAHRYDYRDEWARFTATIGRRDDGEAPLDSRIVKAVADILGAPGGVLLTPEDGALIAAARWRWDALEPPRRAGGEALARQLEATGRIVELEPLRRMDAREDAESAAAPEWMLAERQAYAIVPLLHFDKLQGAVLVSRPLHERRLDWEDFDLLRVVGRQAASTLAEARGQEALSEARRFDEFNRRFAFIVHDIKNLVSQLSLVTRNAEKHAGNPEFQTDMVATLKSSVGKMNDLLARLSQHGQSRAEPPRPVALGAVIARAARQRGVVANIAGEPLALADPARLEQALAHLVQNALEASDGAPVTVRARESGDEVAIEIADRGCGMSAEFIAASLFKPFASTKPGGFGIGAHEARLLVTAMGGRIDVESQEGEGTLFTITLPAAHTERQAA